MKHWDKYVDWLYYLIVVFRFDTKPTLVQMLFHSNYPRTKKQKLKEILSIPNMFLTKIERGEINHNETVFYEMWQK